MQRFEIQKYVDIASRRKYWIIIPLLVAILGGIVYFQVAPRIYEAEALILVQPQRVPRDYVRPIMEGTGEVRLKTIMQQATSRTNLEGIIKECNIDKEHWGVLDTEEIVASVKERIRIDVRGGRSTDVSTFTIAFQDREPETAKRVTDSLVSNFISQNLKTREERAVGTSSFLSEELESVKKRLEAKEDELKGYRERYMGGLPEQLATNLNILERLEAQSEHLGSTLRDAENRRMLIQTQIAERATASTERVLSPAEPSADVRNLQSLRTELASLMTRYTNEHPDVRRLKETIAAFERQAPEKVEQERVAPLGIDLTLEKQLKETELEIKNAKLEMMNIRSQIGWYRKQVEDTPKREQELLSLNRDYENIKGLYSSLLSRKLEAEIAVSMEKKQQGEQFKVLDPAKIPIYPIKPDMTRILFMTLVIGLGLGFGLAYFVEVMDTSYRNPEELESELQVPVVMSIPIKYSERELTRRKRVEFLKAASITVGFFVLGIGVVVASKGLEKTVQYLRDLFA